MVSQTSIVQLVPSHRLKVSSDAFLIDFSQFWLSLWALASACISRLNLRLYIRVSTTLHTSKPWQLPRLFMITEKTPSLPRSTCGHSYNILWCEALTPIISSVIADMEEGSEEKDFDGVSRWSAIPEVWDIVFQHFLPAPKMMCWCLGVRLWSRMFIVVLSRCW